MRPAMKTRRSEDSSLNRFATAFDFTAKATELQNTVLGTVASHLVVTAGHARKMKVNILKIPDRPNLQNSKATIQIANVSTAESSASATWDLSRIIQC